jgi:replication factor C small subunit
LHSRCTNIEFRIPGKEKKVLAEQVFDRCKLILETENIEYNDKVLAELIMKHFPDFRRVLNELQRYSVSGKIDVGILSSTGDLRIDSLMDNMKTKNFNEVRKWVVDNIDNDQTKIFRTIYDGLYDHLESKTIPMAILIIGDYQYKAAFVADPEINITACLVQLMMECEFK